MCHLRLSRRPGPRESFSRLLQQSERTRRILERIWTSTQAITRFSHPYFDTLFLFYYFLSLQCCMHLKYKLSNVYTIYPRNGGHTLHTTSYRACALRTSLQNPTRLQEAINHFLYRCPTFFRPNLRSLPTRWWTDITHNQLSRFVLRTSSQWAKTPQHV